MSRILTSRGTMTISIPPGAKTNADGEYYMVCPICTDSRKPEHQKLKLLAINLKKGDLPWRCNHCGEFGHVMEDTDINQMLIKPVSREFQFVPIPPEMEEWFWKERRIGKETLDYFKISMSHETMLIHRVPDDHPEWKGKWVGKPCINFKYFKDSTLINVKFRDKHKNFKLVSGASMILFNIDSIKDSKECLIVEGEMDCMAYHESGYKSVVSVPNGATVTKEEKENFEATGIMTIKSQANLEYIDLCWDDLQHIEHFIIGTDDDAAGIKLRQELARRLGFEKCSYIKYSTWRKTDGTACKDGNEVLLHNDRKTLLNTLSATIDFPVEGVNTADKYLDVLMKNFKNGRERGLPTGYLSMEAYFNWMRGWLTVINGYPSMGKALDINTDIPTTNGFKKMNDIKIGDIIYDEKGKQCNVIYATDIMYDRPCYEITFSDKNKIICDEEHLWFVYERTARASRARHEKRSIRDFNTTGISQVHLMSKPRVVNTKFIFDNLLVENGKRYNFTIDISEAVINKEIELPINPYVLGAWLGDGTSANANITIGGQDKNEMIVNIKNSGYSIIKNKAKYMYLIKKLQTQLRKSNLLKNKHIPEIYFQSSKKQRLELLNGIMDTDGTIDKNGVIEISLSNEILANDVYTLINSLGIRSSKNINKSFLKGEHKKDRYRINFKTTIPIFKLGRKAEKVLKKIKRENTYRTITNCIKVNSVPVKCIQVDSPSSLYLVSKSYIPTHNTTFMLNLIAISTVLYEWKWGIYSPENYPVENIIDTLAEIFVGKSSDIEFHGRMTEEEYKKVIIDHIKKYIYFVDREEGYSPEDLREIKKQMIQRYGIVGFLTDPWSTLNHPDTQNISMYLEKQLNAETRLATKYSLVNLIAHHPPTPKDTKNIKPPTSFDLIGGQIWFNKVFALLSIHKQSGNIDDLLVDIFVQKIKEHKLAGHPTDSSHYITLKYERRTNRFLERENITDENSPFNTYPIKNFAEYYQQKLEGF